MPEREGEVVVTEQLTDGQRERLTALTNTWEALRHYGPEVLDVVRAAHWVLYGQELEVPGWPPKTAAGHEPDSMTPWHPPVAVG